MSQTEKRGQDVRGKEKELVVGMMILVLAVSLVYANALQGEFVFDDHALVLTRSQLRTEDVASIFWSQKSARLLYRPLRTASYWLDYRLFGLDPWGYHLSNLLLHAATSVAAFVVARRLLPFRIALFAALLFAVHPIQTESVTYISGRRDLLSGLFVLLGFYAFLRYREDGERHWLGAAGLAYLFGLISKEMAVTLPILFLVYDAVQEANRRTLLIGIRQALLRRWWLYAPAGLLGLGFGVYTIVTAHASRQIAYYGGGLGMTALTSARVITHYLKLFLFPATLNADYSYNAFPITDTSTDPRAWLALSLLGLVLFGFIRLASTNQVAAFGGLWFFIALLPVSQLIPHHELMAEHYLYIPAFGLCLGVGAALAGLPDTIGKSAGTLGACLLILVLLGARTVVRNQDWRDDLSLWTKTVRTAPQAARARDNLGRAYLRRGLDAQAEQEFAEAVRIKPDEPRFHDNLGLALFRRGKLADAESQLREALRGNPRLVSAHMNLGLTLLNTGRIEEAAAEFQEALRIRPTVAMAWDYLGRIRLRAGHREEAERMLREAVRLDPRLQEAQALLRTLGRP
jgi:Flp pilus assembly protein TadD